MKLKIEYYSGAGNLFSIIDNRIYNIPEEDFEKLAKITCSKFQSFSIKTEGMIIIKDEIINKNNSFEVNFFNPDGSSGMMCGNGARCAVKFAYDKGIIHKNESEIIRFNLANVDYYAEFENDLINVFFPRYNILELERKIIFDNNEIIASFVDVGTIHLIFDYDEIPFSSHFDFNYYPLLDFAKPIRFNKTEFPDGVNVSIVKVIDRNNIEMRTYERGVEAETGACGTGAISAFIVMNHKGKINDEVKIYPTSKSPLFVNLLKDENGYNNRFVLKGKALKIGETIYQTSN